MESSPNTPPPDHDQTAVMAHVPNVLQMIFRESCEHGLFKHVQSNQLDPEGYLDYMQSRRSGMLSDRITAVARHLFDVSGIDGAWWKIADNDCATEFYLDPFLAFRFKRTKKNRSHKSTGVMTVRRASTQSLVGYKQVVNQTAFLFPGVSPAPLQDDERLWLNIGFDLDEIEESIDRLMVGRETKLGYRWNVPIPDFPPGVLASISGPLADTIETQRNQRFAG